MPEQYDRWNAWEVAKVSMDEFLKILDEAWFNWQTIPPVEENIAHKVSELSSIGQIDIVTGRTEVTVPFAKEWLRSQNVTYNNFVRVNNTAAKANLEYDVFIDDSTYLMTLVAQRLFGYGILYEQPWNRNAASMNRIVKVKGWDEIPPALKQMKNSTKYTSTLGK